MSNPGFQVPTNLYGRHQKCTKERSTKIQDKNKRQADKRQTNKVYKVTHKLHTLTETGPGPISSWSLKDEIKHFIQKMKIKPNTYVTSGMHDNVKMSVFVNGMLVSVGFRRAKEGEPMGLCVE